ncbi:MAG: response regulator transcription factor [Streptosporangiaceae bacterium]|nr:response regulator transcription factor [Streptosporangiaceae bacterium]MBV9853056.1 response regulator transcription factor [Streptosporangiaceae bacterium]
MQVLVVEDDPKVRDLLQRGLEQQSFAVAVAADGAEALWRARESNFDAIVLDVLLPDTDGFTVCGELRVTGSWAPILMLTALDDVQDRVRGLNAGADDYLIKPFDLAELVARLQALFRRGRPPRPVTLRVGDLSLDPAGREVRRGEQPIELTAREFSLLEYFMRHPSESLSRTRLLQHVWDDAFDGDPHVVSVYVSYLRDKIDRPFGRSSLQTLRGAGYRLRDDLAAPATD